MKTGKRGKKPKVGGKIPRTRKVPRAEPMPDSESMNPAWQIGQLEWHAPWGWSALDAATAKRIRDRLGNLESMTWADLRRTGSHPIGVPKLCANARRRLVELSLDDFEVLYSLRVAGRERIWGIRDQNILRILWWDPDHEVCPVEKRRT